MSRPRLIAAAAVVLAVFALGIALGEALHDNPHPGIQVTSTKTIHP